MRAIQKLMDSRKTMVLAFLCILLIFSVRLINLDQDMPAWGLTNYTPVDEGSYSILALNMQNHGTINPVDLDGKYTFYTPPHVRTNVVGNAVSYISLKILGDNYYGLRMPSILFGLINFLLFFLIINEIRKQYGKDKNSERWVNLGMLLYLALDFIFFVSNRVIEPSIVRMIFIQLVFYVVLRMKDSYKLRFFIIGALTTLSVFLVYITNVFVYIGCGCILLWIWYTRGRKDFLSAFISFCIGSLSVLIICEIYYLMYWDTTALLNMFNSIFDFSSVSGYTSEFSVKSIVKSFIRFFSSNMFLYNIPVAASFILALPSAITLALRKKDINIVFILTVIGGFLLQTLVSEDYIVRKFIVIYTLVVFLIMIVWYSKKNIDILLQDSTSKLNLKHKFTIKVVYIIFTMLFCMGIVLFRIKILRDFTPLDFTKLDKGIILLLGLAPVVFVLGIYVYNIFTNPKEITGYLEKGLKICFVCSALGNIFFITHHILVNPTFTERNNMIELGNLANDKYVLGEYENGFSLYNTIKPVLNEYEVLREYMEENNELYYFDYHDNYDGGMRNFFDNILFKGSDYTVIPIYEFKREFQTFGDKKSMALYRVVKKSEAIKLYRERYFEEEKHAKKDKDYRLEIENVYPDHRGNVLADISSDVFVNIYGDIYGNIDGDIYGDVYGNIYGNVNGIIYGDVNGVIYGDVNGKIYGINSSREELKISEKN